MKLAPLLIALCACTSGIDPNAPVAAQVNQQGGTITLGETASVTVGAGALGQQVIVTVAPTVAPVQAQLPATAVGKVVEFTPHGTTFSVPARITLGYDPKRPASGLRVLRLADDKATSWEPVGGAKFANGVATFETTHFSLYAVAEGYACAPVDDSVACSATCECCGGASCVDLATSPRNCGACGQACDAASFCSGAATCVPVAQATLCENKSVAVLLGEVLDLSGAAPAETTDSESAAALAGALVDGCGATAVTARQADPGVLDPCNDAPLYGAGTTIVAAGGIDTQRIARYLQASSAAPVSLNQDPANPNLNFTSRSGQLLADFPRDQITASHDFFVVALVPDPARGALVLLVYGIGESGTIAATWHFLNHVLPDMRAGKRAFQSYVVMEWTDDGDGVPGEGDTWTLLGQDVP